MIIESDEEDNSKTSVNGESHFIEEVNKCFIKKYCNRLVLILSMLLIKTIFRLWMTMLVLVLILYPVMMIVTPLETLPMV